MDDSRSHSRAEVPLSADANPSYALGQLARALATSQDHPDAATRERADRRISDWLRVFGGMLSGVLRVGSRTPVRGAPAWATPRIIQGGFATGELLAGGSLQAHEEALLSVLPVEERAGGRAALNAYFLTEQGLGELMEMLQTGHFRVDVPEEGALLVVAWLAQNGHADAARAILDEIGPHFATLRFYPAPSSAPLRNDGRVRLQSVGEAVATLEATRTPEEILTQTEALTVWLPYLDRIVALFAETVTGSLPTLVSQDAEGRSAVEGGWPCQVYPDGWTERARSVLREYDRLRAEHTHSTKPDRTGTNLHRLRTILSVAAANPARLTGRDVGVVRATLAWIRAKRGLPGSVQLAHLRTEQARVAALPTKTDWAHAFAARLSEPSFAGGLDPDRGDLDAALAPVTEAEALHFKLPTEKPFGGRYRSQFLHLLRRASDAPPEQHVAWGTIASGETLARVVPQLTARVRSAGFTDPTLRRLDEAVYAAFRRRRSVLLLNLQHQVKLGELPWMQALEAFRQERTQTKAAAHDLLTRVVTLALTAFPHQILPNKLLQEIRALAGAAGLTLPIVDEVAADIFMGTFSEKYLRAAQIAADVLEGTLYERYYGIDYAYVRSIDDVQPSKYGPPTSPAFDRLCHERARLAEQPVRRWRSVAENGAVLEQEQVLTTHNLATLISALGLAESRVDRLDEWARRCFVWVCDEIERLRGSRWGQLRAVKNAAYAWRQMVFYLALVPPKHLEAFLEWASDHLSQRSENFQERFRPILTGLASAIGTYSDDIHSQKAQEIRSFYGWASEGHALLAQVPRPPTA